MGKLEVLVLMSKARCGSSNDQVDHGTYLRMYVVRTKSLWKMDCAGDK